MVRHLTWFNLFILKTLCLFALGSTYAMAESKLNASVDRNKIYENDTLNLTVTGEIEVEFSFGGLMNFGRNQIEAPDMTALLEDFEILDQNQNYSMRSINGNSQAQITWNYSLAPKRTGTLRIPSISYQGASSNELSIQVESGRAPRNADTPPLVFIEAEVDKQSAYVQEQVKYTLRLYSADHLATGDLSEPAPSDAIVESLGDTKKYYRMAYNQRYEVRERQYLLFPQKSGELTIEAQHFNGMLIDTRTRRRQRVRESSEPVVLDIKPPPASFSGEVWLPAASFEMAEKWDKEPYDLKVGDSVTRTIDIAALGLLGSALPPVTMSDIDGLKVYPDQPLVESYEHETGSQSLRQETAALVAIAPTQVTLPEIRIPWWDTVNDVERVAIIPSRPFSIAPNPEQPQAQPPAPAVVQVPNAPEENATSRAPDIVEENDAFTPAQAPTAEPVNNQPWYLIIALLIIGWISTTWLLLSRQKQLQTRLPEPPMDSTVNVNRLIKAIKDNDQDIPKLTVAWANDQFGNITCIDDVKALSPTLHQALKSIEEQLYSPRASQELTFNQADLIKCIKELNQSDKTPSKSSTLQPMYP